MESILYWLVVGVILFAFFGGFVVHAIVVAVAKARGKTFDS